MMVHSTFYAAPSELKFICGVNLGLTPQAKIMSGLRPLDFVFVIFHSLKTYKLLSCKRGDRSLRCILGVVLQRFIDGGYHTQ
jgi:hypothetical protein